MPEAPEVPPVDETEVPAEPSVEPDATAVPEPLLPAEALAAELGITVEELAADLGLTINELLLMDEESLNKLYTQLHADEYGIEPVAESQEPYFEIDKNGWLSKYEGPGGEVVVPDNVTLILGGVFENREDLTSVILPEGLYSLWWAVFQGCTN